MVPPALATLAPERWSRRAFAPAARHRHDHRERLPANQSRPRETICPSC